MSRALLLAVALLAAACSKTPSGPDALTCTGPHAAGSACGDPCEVGNEKGVGAFCTSTGGECGNNPSPFIYCTILFDSTAEPYCTGPCTKDSDCGTGAYCSGGSTGAMGCVPATCGGTPTARE
jgi:hypothetical protein